MLSIVLTKASIVAYITKNAVTPSHAQADMALGLNAAPSSTAPGMTRSPSCVPVSARPFADSVSSPTPSSCVPASARPSARLSSLARPVQTRPRVGALQRPTQSAGLPRPSLSLRRRAPAPNSVPSPTLSSCVTVSVRHCARLSPLAHPSQHHSCVSVPLRPTEAPCPSCPVASLR